MASQHANNLARLTQELREARLAAGLPDEIPESNSQLASRLPLTHGVTSKVLYELADDPFKIGRKLLSARRFAQVSRTEPNMNNAEAALNTQDVVFLFCGQFRYPKGQAGFLFHPSLETEPGTKAEASPFDSGGLHKHYSGPDTAEPPVAFLARHTLPVPGYRQHFAERLAYLFDHPHRFVTSEDAPHRPDPIRLQAKAPGVKPDPRWWTFELRVRDEVPVAAPGLGAVFYSTDSLKHPAVVDFLGALPDTVDTFELQPDDESDFAALRRQCVDFLHQKHIL